MYHVHPHLAGAFARDHHDDLRREAGRARLRRGVPPEPDLRPRQRRR